MISHSTDSSAVPSPLKRWLIIFGKALLLVVVLAACGGVALKIWSDQTFYAGYDQALTLVPQQHQITEVENGFREELQLQLSAGQQVPVILFRPERTATPAPCLVFLYGIGQKLSFLDQIAPEYLRAGIAIVGYEQYGQGVRKIPGLRKKPLQAVAMLRRRAGLVVPETRRLIDYLVTRAELDDNALYLLGVSFGAITGAAAMAHEPRIQAGIMMWGGADLSYLVKHSPQTLRRVPSWGRGILSGVIWFLSPAEPLNHLAALAPRPLLFQNPQRDEVFPRHCIELFYDSAPQPKQQLWYDCGHEQDLTPELVRMAIADQIHWLNSLLVAH